MADLTLTEEQAEQLVETLVDGVIQRKGARRITFADQSVEFESITDSLKAIQEVRASSGGSLTRYASTSKGV